MSLELIILFPALTTWADWNLSRVLPISDIGLLDIKFSPYIIPEMTRPKISD